MRLPGFGAEAAIYRCSRNYAALSDPGWGASEAAPHEYYPALYGSPSLYGVGGGSGDSARSNVLPALILNRLSCTIRLDSCKWWCNRLAGLAYDQSSSLTACLNRCAKQNMVCSRECVDATSDPNNCGNCGNVCGSGQTCCNGTCLNGPCLVGIGDTCDVSADCASALTCCGSSCVDTSTDPNNCGGCGADGTEYACGPGGSCKSGTCRCTGDEECASGGECSNGTCPCGGEVCESPFTCYEGQCQPPPGCYACNTGSGTTEVCCPNWACCGGISGCITCDFTETSVQPCS